MPCWHPDPPNVSSMAEMLSPEAQKNQRLGFAFLTLFTQQDLYFFLSVLTVRRRLKGYLTNETGAVRPVISIASPDTPGLSRDAHVIRGFHVASHYCVAADITLSRDTVEIERYRADAVANLALTSQINCDSKT
ncbi:hypothetical protein Tco_1292148 [Tanacetum coccineum]